MERHIEMPLKWERSRIVLGLLIIYTVFESAAQWLESERGEAGLIVLAIVLLTCLGVERAIFCQAIGRALRSLGLGRPAARGWIVAIGVVAALLLILVALARSSAVSLEITADALQLMPGLFAQGGVAEETLFRGYLYRHFRMRRSAWHAGTLAMLPFAAVHVLLFLVLPWHIALIALLAAAALSFPLAHLFEISGNSLWPPALVHFAIQAVPKVTVVTGVTSSGFAIFWMILATVVLWLGVVVDQVWRRQLEAVERSEAPLARTGGPDDRDAEGGAYVLAKD